MPRTRIGLFATAAKSSGQRIWEGVAPARIVIAKGSRVLLFRNEVQRAEFTLLVNDAGDVQAESVELGVKLEPG